MICGLQIIMLLFGVWMMTRSSIRFGTHEIRTPFTTYAGIVLALQIPMAAGAGMAIGGAEGIRAVRAGNDPVVSSAKIENKYRWLDLALVTAGGCLAAAIAALGWREVRYVPPPPDEPIGITDYRLKSLDPWIPPHTGDER